MDLIDNCTRSRGKLNRNSYCSWSHSNPTNSNQWMERKRRKWGVGGVCGCGGWWEGNGDGLSMFVSVSSLSLFMVLYLMCLFDFDFSGDYVIELFGKWIATHRLSNCKSPHHDYRGICFLWWKDNWFWSHRLQWNISCSLWVSWIHRMGWITACIIGTMDCKERQE